MEKIAIETDIKKDCIDFLQRLIQTESRSGEEKDIAKLVISEMKLLNYDEVYADEAGNVIGKIEGHGKAPPIMFNTHLEWILVILIDGPIPLSEQKFMRVVFGVVEQLI